MAFYRNRYFPRGNLESAKKNALTRVFHKWNNIIFECSLGKQNIIYFHIHKNYVQYFWIISCSYQLLKKRNLYSISSSVTHILILNILFTDSPSLPSVFRNLQLRLFYRLYRIYMIYFRFKVDESVFYSVFYKFIGLFFVW